MNSNEFTTLYQEHLKTIRNRKSTSNKICCSLVFLIITFVWLYTYLKLLSPIQSCVITTLVALIGGVRLDYVNNSSSKIESATHHDFLVTRAKIK